MIEELKDIIGLDGYLIRIATILKIANLQHDPLKVSKDEVDMLPKDMFYRIRSMFEQEYTPVYRLIPLSEEDIVNEYKKAFLAVSDDLEIATEVLNFLMVLCESYQAPLQILTQFLLDNPNVSAIEFYNLAGALYFIDSSVQ